MKLNPPIRIAFKYTYPRSMILFTRTKVYFAILVALAVASALHVRAGEILPSSEISKETGWSLWINPRATSAGAVGEFKDGAANFKISPEKSVLGADVQLIRQVNFDLDKDYLVKVKIASNKPIKLSILYSLTKEPYTSYAFTNLDIAPGERYYEFKIKVRIAGDNSTYVGPRSFRFILGDAKDSELKLSSISVEESF